MRVAAFILARAGSKGLPGKNIRPLNGKPLITWTIDAAKSCPEISDVYVSTDGDDIAQIARNEGVEVLHRPSELASDTASPKDGVIYHIKQLEAQNIHHDIIALLQPTSPLRTSEEISQCVRCVLSGGVDSSATFVENEWTPYRAWYEQGSEIVPIMDPKDVWLPRQKYPKTYSLNGAVYVVKKEAFMADNSNAFLSGRIKKVVMSKEKSVDIDTLNDFEVIEAFMKSVDLKGGRNA